MVIPDDTAAAAGTKISAGVLGILAFAAFGLATLGLSWHIIAATGVEAGDFAANSILIQAAKRFGLTLGNYSRVGFNHPGPAILYVLAAGEAIFHDALGWATPVGGQIIAACLYNSAWLGLVAAMLRRIGLGTLQIAVVLGIAVAAIAMRDPKAFDTIWFPYLYELPFLAFVVALIGVAYGDRPAWIAVAVSGGVLVNGHVCFFGVCGIAVTLVVIESIFVGRRFVHAWSLGAGVIFAVFLVPLVLRQMTESPGPLEFYASFAARNGTHGLVESLSFLRRGVATTSLGLAAVALALAAILARPRDPLHRATVVAVVAVTLGTVYYVVRGVDRFTQVNEYVLIYFGAVPALLLAIAGHDAVRRVGTKTMYFAAAGLAFAIWATALHADAPMPDYNQPLVAALDRDLDAIGSRRFTLSPHNAPNWGRVWATMVGVEARRVRAGRPIGFCLAEYWTVLFAEVARCGPSDADNPRLWVDRAGAPRPTNLAVVLTSGDLDFLSAKK